MIWSEFQPGYFISENGNIKNNKEKILRQQLDSKKRYCIWRGKLVHRLVAITFLSNPNNYTDINHKDGNKTNNTITNLEWVSKSQNTLHAYQNGLLTKSKGFCSEKKVCLTKDNEKYFCNSVTDASKYLGVCQTAVSNCIYGRSKSCKGYSISLID